MTAACKIHNASIESQTLPAPLNGTLAPGQNVVLPMSASTLFAICPSLAVAPEFLQVTDLGPSYTGPVDSAYLSGKVKHLIAFTAATIAAAQAAASATLAGAANVNMNLVAGRAGRVTGIFAELGAAPNGTDVLTIDAYKNGVAFTAAADGTKCESLIGPVASGKKKAQTLDGYNFSFAQGDELSVRLTTTAGWTTTTTPLLGFLEVEW